MSGEKKGRLIFSLAFLSVVTLLSSTAQGEPNSKHKLRKVKKEFTANTPSNEHIGLFIGSLVLIDQTQSSIFVKPIGRSGPQKRFYYDHKTVFLSNSKAISLSELPLGARVALKYFGEGIIFVADTVNVIPEDLAVTDQLVKGWMRGGSRK